MTIYTIYKTTNIINGKYYIGKTSSSRKDYDTYLGSGVALNRAIKKYGRKNFFRETLYTFVSEEKCYEKEKEIVTPELCSLEECYNMMGGGLGGRVGNRLGHTTSEETKLKQKKANLEQVSCWKGKKLSEEHKKKLSASKLGIRQSEEHIQKHKEAMLGRKWYYNPDSLKSGLFFEQPNGWLAGRRPS